MSRCYICENPITESNKSVEHVFLNSIGGRLKSEALMCRQCNTELVCG